MAPGVLARTCWLGRMAELTRGTAANWSGSTLTDTSAVAQGVERGALDLFAKCQIILLMFMEVPLCASQDSGTDFAGTSPLDVHRNPRGPS